MNFRRVGIGTVMFAAALATAAPTVVQAAPITGVATVGGSLAITAGGVDFYGGAVCATPGVGVAGCFGATLPLSGSFAGLPSQGAGLIQDLLGPPLTGSISLPGFMTFVNGVGFDLTAVIAGGAPDCATVNQNGANVQCTPYLPGNVATPFVLTNDITGTNASLFFGVRVNGYTGSLATGFTQYTGTFAASMGQNIAGILTNIGTGAPVTAAYSASFLPTQQTAPVPEPGTLALLGLGLAGLGLNRRRKA